jgi:hypothetical protein
MITMSLVMVYLYALTGHEVRGVSFDLSLIYLLLLLIIIIIIIIIVYYNYVYYIATPLRNALSSKHNKLDSL